MSVSIKEALALIDEMYLYQVGPFGTVISEECREAWVKKYKRVSFVQVPAYIELLIAEIDSEDSIDEFIRDLKNIDELNEVLEIKNYLNTR